MSRAFILVTISAGADPGFQVRGGALKKIAPSGGRRENFWGISCEKSQFYAKKIIFYPILGGGALAGCAPPPGSAPAGVCVHIINCEMCEFCTCKNLEKSIGKNVWVGVFF